MILYFPGSTLLWNKLSEMMDYYEMRNIAYIEIHFLNPVRHGKENEV